MDRSTFFDLACENIEEKDLTENHQDVHATSSPKIQIRRGSDELHGNYTVFFTEPIWQMGEKRFFEMREILAQELWQFLLAAFEEKFEKEKTLLVAGLGNSKMTADALGAEVVERVEITRKMEENNSSFFSVCAVGVGVLGTTGIETFEHIDALCRYLHPSAVLAIDALSAKSQSRVGAAIQISSGGISPGGGVGNPQKNLSKETLGVPVISMGIPTVVRSSVMIREAMESLGISLTHKEKEGLSRDSFFMMPKESDLLLQRAALLLSSAIRRVCDFSY
ncbi:MAG: GPR endopeptidase [Clostridia bacterium]|nr:GPR endopeptidase [Clostridia bacterium]